MFTQYFGLKFNPFEKEIAVDNLFMGQDMQELDSRLKYLRNTRGIGLVVGEPGSGKSTALRKFATELNKSLYKPCYLALSTLTIREFYHALATMLGEEPTTKKITLFNQIQTAISLYYYEQKITPVIILDEIHMVTNAVLEDLRMIFNFKMDSSNPFILILSGQPLIRSKLALNINNPLKQRISIKYVMQGLKKEELSDYCKSRLKFAGCNQEIFTSGGLEALYSATKGLPRVLNSLITSSLIYAFTKNQKEVDEEIVYQSQNELNI